MHGFSLRPGWKAYKDQPLCSLASGLENESSLSSNLSILTKRDAGWLPRGDRDSGLDKNKNFERKMEV
jgi:hypothetical protein